MVVRCETHRNHFTLYPHGHVPYGRSSIAPVAPDGSLLIRKAKRRRKRNQDPSLDERFRRAKDFSGTYFDAALDASEGIPWPREASGGSVRWWGVQERRLHRSTRWLGVAPGTAARKMQTIAHDLAVDTLLLAEEKKSISETPGYRSRGRAVSSALGALAEGRLPVLDRLLAAGYHAGLWGRPFRWDFPPGVLRPLVFSRSRPRGP